MLTVASTLIGKLHNQRLIGLKKSATIFVSIMFMAGGAIRLFTGTSPLYDMRHFDELFSEDKIIHYLCKLRAKVAKQRNKKHLLHLLTENKKFNYHNPSKQTVSKHEKEFSDLLNSLFPPRNSWKKLGRTSRNKQIGDKIQKISSIDRNVYSLVKTIKYFRAKEPSAPFVKKLNDFILDVQTSVKNNDYFICPPVIYPKAKEKQKPGEYKSGEKNVCRPISIFGLKDRVILSFTNKFLSHLFDQYFEPCSLAFRATQNELVNHHTAIRNIQGYKSEHKTTPLWVAECDMKKFYDSVNHTIIKNQLDSLINRAKKDFPNLQFGNCYKIFMDYLTCYCFNINVLPLNGDIVYWESYKIPNGEFGWIQKEIVKHKFYSDISNERIGVPQGGALSGLIANMVLDISDKKILAKYKDLFYTRFCDDMIIIHPDKDVCLQSVTLYKQTLEDLQLAPHEFVPDLIKARETPKKYLPEKSLTPFWKEKSKGPFLWDSVKNGGFPWIGFVGYEIHYDGYIRVRKSSLEKELKKQKEVIMKIEEAILEKQKASPGTVTESAIRRLIGMSVSRVELWNYPTVCHEMCWKNGFQELNPNKYSIRQIKRLDKGRSKVYYTLVKTLSGVTIIKKEETQETAEETIKKKRQIVAYDKPFSYFYHVIEKAKVENPDKDDPGPKEEED